MTVQIIICLCTDDEVTQHNYVRKYSNYSAQYFFLKGCPTDYYKNTITKYERCQKCPEGRKNNAIHTRCECKKDHYTGEDEDGPCYGIYLNHFYIYI